MIQFLRRTFRYLSLVGINAKALLSLKNFYKFRKDIKKWLRQGGKITQEHIFLQDYDDNAGTTRGHYFHQDLLVAKMIHDSNPERHVDVGSRFDGFVAHVASFREIEVFDLRPLEESLHKNIKFIQADLMNPLNFEKTESLSCLHAIEHFGLGRYSDQIDINGHIKGINNLLKMLKNNGTLYISFPIGRSDAVHFNAHRIFHPKTILNFKSADFL